MINNKKWRAIFFTAYFIIVILLTKLICSIDCKIRDGVIIRDINNMEGVTETEKPE